MAHVSGFSLFIDGESIKQMNKIERKNYILRLKLVSALIENQGMTFAEIGNWLKISSPKTLELVNGLMTDEIIVQDEKGVSIGGRKPIINKLKSGLFHVLCVEVERFGVKLTVIDNSNNKVCPTQFFPIDLSADQSALEPLLLIIERYLQGAGIPRSQLLGVGMSMPGLIDIRHGHNLTYLYEGTDGQSLKAAIAHRLGKPVHLTNDVKNAAVAELKFGYARDKKDVLVILMDWGIGLGIIMDGKLRNGTNGFSGEIGHIPFVEDGNLCYCGKKGCLETVASGIALARLAKEGIRSGQASLLTGLIETDVDNIEPKLVIQAANKGDQFAINILSSIGEKLGKGIATLVQLFNPELIILAGKIAEAKQYITVPIQQAINTYCMTPIRNQAEIRVSKLAGDAGAMGVANSFLEHYFRNHVKSVEH